MIAQRLTSIASALTLTLTVWLAAGCATTPAPIPAQPATPPPAATFTPAPAGIAEGRVSVVNAELRFVVLDFGQHSVPDIGRELELFRDGRRIGELRLTEPRRGRLISADILNGEPRVGDVAR